MNQSTVRLEEACQMIRRGKQPKYSNDGTGIPVINQKMIQLQGFNLGYVKFHNPSVSVNELLFVREGDTLINSTGTGTAGRVVYVNKDMDNYGFVDSHVTIVRPNKDLVNPLYIYYYLKNKSSEIENLAVGSTGQIEINASALRHYKIYLPSRSIQDRIASLLNMLDKKIDINHKINETLEEMTMTLYKRWFVDKISTNEKVMLDELIEINPRLSVKKGTKIGFIEMKCVPEDKMSIKDSDIQIREFGSGSKFQKNDTLFARITPCLENGKTAFVDFLIEDEVGAGSTEFLVLRVKEKVCPQYVYCLARDVDFRNYAQQRMVGTSGRQRVQKDVLLRYELFMPDVKKMEQFKNLTEGYFQQIRTNILEIQSLEAIRDYLLPRLLNEEISLSQSKEQVLSLF